MGNITDALNNADGLLAFYGDGQAAFAYHDNGDIIFKHVSVATLRRAFSGETLDSGWVSPGLMRWGIDTTGEWWVRYAPPSLYTLDLDGGKIVTVPLPGMIMFAHSYRAFVYALKTDFSPAAQLYQAPLPNCYSDGRVCWGQNGNPEAKLTNVEAVWKLFFTSPFNRDLANQKSRKHLDNVTEMLLELSAGEAARYPLEDLVPVGVGTVVTVEALLTQLIGGRN